jgi:hypothetical protein
MNPDLPAAIQTILHSKPEELHHAIATFRKAIEAPANPPHHGTNGKHPPSDR